MLCLPDVTLCSIYTNCHELTLMAADACTGRVKFGDVKLFTDQALGRDVIPIENFSSTRAFEEYTNYQLLKHIKTSHILFFQWDSWVLNPELWTDEFLKYDYVGAPWWYQDEHNVGNSGFCLRSKALMDFLAAHKEDFPIGKPEDAVLCREYQERLPQFKWAPQELAWQFAFERTRLYPKTFGFHGVFNWRRVLSSEEIEKRLIDAPDYVFKMPEFKELLQLMLESDNGQTDSQGTQGNPIQQICWT